MKRIILQLGLLVATFCAYTTNAQVILADDFSNGIPSSWTLNSAGGATWIHSNSLGLYGSGCILIDQSQVAGATKGVIETTSVDLTTVTHPTFSFKVAAIRSNFVAPVLNIYYSANGGAWQKLSSWGEYQTDNIINTSGPCNPSASTTCATWVTVTYDLDAVANSNNIRFALEGDLINGGWLIVDDLKIAERAKYTMPYSHGFEVPYFLPEDWQQRSSSSTAFVQWQHDKTVGSFNTTSSAKFDNWNSNVDSTFTLDMVWLDLTGVTKPTLRFDYAYAKRTGKPSDKLSIWYKIGNGTEKMLVEYKENDLITTFDRSTQFVPNNREWLTKYVDLSQFVGVNDIRFSIRNTSQNGNVVYVDNVQIYDDTATSIPETKYSSSLQAYPNPANDLVNISIDPNTVNKVMVYDVKGSSMSGISYTLTGDQITISLSNLSDGVYYIHVYTNDGKMNRVSVSVIR